MKNKNAPKTWYALSFALQLGFLVVVPVGGLMFLGIWSDKAFQTSPFLLIFGITTGLGIAVYEIYHLLIPLIKNNHD